MSSGIVHYFAYGSNLHPLRLMQRVPSAELIGTVKVKRRKLTFSKRSQDGSGKCNFFQTGNEADIVYGALYKLNENERDKLDQVEGLGKGYNLSTVTFELQGEFYSPFTYVADSQAIDETLQPYDWYLYLVVEGAKFHQFPAEYIDQLKATASIPDPNSRRNEDGQKVLEQLIEYTKAVKA